MRFAEAVRAVCVLWIGLVFVGCGTSGGPSTGWGINELPQTQPARDVVLKAAKSVISQRYPQSSVSEDSGFVYALGPVQMDGGSKTRKQILVVVRRNFTGAYEPEVSVRQYVATGMPQLDADPGSGNAVYAAPIDRRAWQALDYLPYEEQAIYEAILAQLPQADSSPAPASS